MKRNRKSQSHLYDFVRQMSKDEKRYFTQVVKGISGGRNNLGLQLFKIINDNLQKENREIDDKITFTKNTSKLKNNLYHQLLEITTSHSLEKNLYPKLRVQLNKIGLLYSRGLHKAALKLVNETLKQAESIEANKILVELYEYKISLLQHQNAKVEDSHQLTAKGREAMKKAEEEFESFKLLSDGFVIQRARSRKKEQYAKLFKESYEKALKLQHPAASFNTLFYTSSLMALAHNYQNNPKEEERTSKNTYLLFKNNPLMKKYRVHAYNTAVNNYAVSKMQRKDYHGAIDLLGQLEDKDLSLYEKMVVFQYRAGNQLGAQVQTGEIEHLSDFVSWVEEGLTIYDNYLSDLFKVVILNNLSEYYFWKKNYKKAKLYSNQLLNQSFANVRRDIFRVTNAFILIICFEAGDIDYLRYLLKSYKSSSKLKNKTIGERWMIQFMEDVLKEGKLSDSFFLQKELDLLQTVLNSQKLNDPIDLSAFNLLIWIRCKTDQRSLKNIFYEYNSKELLDYVKERIKELS